VTHLLDSSAFFAFFFDEPGRQRVEELLREPTVEAGLSVLTSVELWARLKAEGRGEAFEQEWEDHLPLFERIISGSDLRADRGLGSRTSLTVVALGGTAIARRESAQKHAKITRG